MKGWATCNLGCCPGPPARSAAERRVVPAPMRLAAATVYLREVELDLFSEPYLWNDEVYVPVPEWNPTYWDDDADLPHDRTWRYRLEWRRWYGRRRIYNGITGDLKRRFVAHKYADTEVGRAIRAGRVRKYAEAFLFETRSEAREDEVRQFDATPKKNRVNIAR